MTEKRFEAKTIRADKRADWVVGVFDNGVLINNFGVVHILNKLAEENNAVKDIINELNSMDFYRDSALLDEYLGKIARAVGCEWE